MPFSRTAVVRMLPTSLPDCGSVIAASATTSPAAYRGIQYCFCASEPDAKMTCEEISVEMNASSPAVAGEYSLHTESRRAENRHRRGRTPPAGWCAAARRRPLFGKYRVGKYRRIPSV
jgi:hypothetical protein